MTTENELAITVWSADDDGKPQYEDSCEICGEPLKEDDLVGFVYFDVARAALDDRGFKILTIREDTVTSFAFHRKCAGRLEVIACKVAVRET